MLLNIQALRALAAFLVVFVHLEVLASRAHVAAHSLDFGNGGVDLFFVISGVIMVFTTERREVTASSFAAHRFARIVPFYWFMTLAVFSIATLAPQLVQSTRADLGELVRSLAFIPFKKANGLTQPVVFVGWTLNYEMAFYLLFAAGMLTGRRLLGLALSGAALLLVVVLGVLVRPKDTLGAFYTAPIILEFGFGMALSLVRTHLPAGRRLRIAWSAAAIAALGAMIAGPSLWPDVDRVFVFGVPATVLVASALALERSGIVFATPVLKRLGDASYATYLTHFFVTQLATMAALMLGIQGSLPIALWCVAIFVMVGIVGLAVHYAIEKPLSASARRLMRRPAVTAQPVVLPA